MSRIGKEIIITTGILFLLLLSPALSYFFNQEVDDLREHVFILLNFGNSSTYPKQSDWFIVNNPDKRNMYVTLQLIPLPLYEDCYTYLQQCNSTFWDPSFEVIYTSPNNISNKVIADTISCWNWWNTSSIPDVGQIEFLFQREENKTLCPVVSIPFTTEDEYFNVTFNRTPSESGKALPRLNVRVFTYSTAYTESSQKYSTTIDETITNNAELIFINKNLWLLIYYSLIIVLVIVGALIVVGGIPLALKWIIDKMRG